MADDLNNHDKIYITVDLNKTAGDIVPPAMKELFKNNKLTDNEINNLLTKDYSKNIFNISIPFFKEIDPNLYIKTQIQDHHGRNRYYKDPLIGKYLLYSQWSPNYKQENFIKWLKNLDPSIIVDIIPVTQDAPLPTYTDTHNEYKTTSTNTNNDDKIYITVDLNKKTKNVIFTALETLFKNNKLTDNEINNLLDKNYTKNTFNLNFPMLKKIDPNIDISIQKQDHLNNNRYYATPLINKYLLCHEWFENDKPLFAEWVKNLDPSVIVDIIPKEENTNKNTNNINVQKPKPYQEKTLNLFLLDNVYKLNKEQIYILTLFISKFGEEALMSFTATKYIHVYELIASKTMGDFDIQAKTLYSVKSDFDNAILGKIQLTGTPKDVYDQYKDYDLQRFTDLIRTFQNDNTKLLNQEEVITLLFLVSKFKDIILQTFNYKTEKDFYEFIVLHKSFDQYPNSVTLNSTKLDITGYLNGTYSASSVQTKELCDQIKNKPLKDFTPLIEKVKNLHKQLDIHDVLKLATPLNKPYNRILYGAPGTGKSHLINDEIKTYGLEHTRVTFYDGYTYGQFVGSYKPVPFVTDKGEKSITYEYVAGPLMQSIVKAIKNPNMNYCLIIEEINRARADRVFGNIFQLLDRNHQGESQYEIDLSKEQKEFLKKAFQESELTENYQDKLTIPKNLYIWATMNSADQGVYVLDSAFKRRWNFEHMGLDDNQDNFGKREISYLINYEKNKTISWNDFRITVNNILISEEQVHEDKLMAPFFIKDTDFTLDDSQENIAILDENVFIGKILMYLFDDILKHKNKNSLFAENIKTFSQLKKYFTNNENIFQDNILKENQPTQETQEHMLESSDQNE